MVRDLVIKSRAIHQAGRFGRWQIVMSLVAVVAVAAAAFLYVQIKRAEVREAEARARLLANQHVLTKLKQRVAEIEAEKNVDLPTPESIRASVVKFEEKFLSPGEEAELTVVREINRLAKETGVDLSDINFDAIEQKVQETGTARRAGQGGKSLFPGLEMSFTVEGEYSDVRQFLLALEGSRAFVIINSLDLKSIEASGSRGRGRVGPAPATDQVVALGIKISVYYQRESV